MFSEEKHPRLLTIHGACRLIEIFNDKGEKHLAFFGTYCEPERLGKYIMELTLEEEIELFKFLNTRYYNRMEECQ